MKKFSLFIFAFLFACSNSKDVSYNYPDNPDYVRKSRAGNALSEGDLVVYGKKKKLDAKNVTPKSEDEALQEAYEPKAKTPLWQASVEIVGALFPIAILNPESKIITSEWYQDSPNSSERIKINVLVKGQEPIKENLRITIFRQKKSSAKNASADSWENLSREDSDSSSSLSIKLLQDQILAKAQTKQNAN